MIWYTSCLSRLDLHEVGHGAALKIISISRSAFSVLAFLAIAEIADGFSFYVFSFFAGIL